MEAKKSEVVVKASWFHERKSEDDMRKKRIVEETVDCVQSLQLARLMKYRLYLMQLLLLLGLLGGFRDL